MKLTEAWLPVKGAILLIRCHPGNPGPNFSPYPTGTVPKNLYLIPVINKIDLTNANVEEVLTELNKRSDLKKMRFH